jgi:tubulin--tyrosine ligase
LTNDAVQKKSDTYGQHEPGNKISYAEFSEFLSQNFNVRFEERIEPQIRKIVTDTIAAAAKKIDANRRLH